MVIREQPQIHTDETQMTVAKHTLPSVPICVTSVAGIVMYD